MASQNTRLTDKERGLIKGALRRIFSRSELRKSILNSAIISHSSSKHPRVTKWALCAICNQPFPAYKANIDHIKPLLEVGRSLKDYTWDELIERLWCDESNLQVLDPICHKAKTKSEQKDRALTKRIK